MTICSKSSTFAGTISGLLLAVAVAIAGVTTPTPARALACLNCSTWVIQLLEYARLVAGYVKQLEQYQTQIDQYRTQVEQFRNMVKHSRNLTQFNFDNALRSVEGIRNVVRQARGVTYTTHRLEDQFRAQFPDLGRLFIDARARSRDRDIYQDFDRQSARTDEGLSVALQTLMAARSQAEDMRYEQTNLDRIAAQLSGADGHMDVMQSVGQFSQHSAQQLMRLREVSLLQVNLATREAARLQRQEAEALAADRAFIIKQPPEPQRRGHTSANYPRGLGSNPGGNP